MPPPPDGSNYGAGGNFFSLLTQAVADFQQTGFVSSDHLTQWMERLRRAAIMSLVPESVVEAELRRALRAIYQREVERGGALKAHRDIGRFTLQQVKPKLRAELDRRIMSSASLIKLNRQQAVETTLRRFSGWATSIPIGGSLAVERNPVKMEIRKSLAQMPFVDRRVAIDQGAKLVSSINHIIASDGGAIAMVWRSHWRQRGYDYREDHKLRDGHTYLIRGSWAANEGLVKPGPDGYSDTITAPGEEVFCQCSATYLYHPKRLPEDMVTAKGRAWIEQASARVGMAA